MFWERILPLFKSHSLFSRRTHWRTQAINLLNLLADCTDKKTVVWANKKTNKKCKKLSIPTLRPAFRPVIGYCASQSGALQATCNYNSIVVLDRSNVIITQRTTVCCHRLTSPNEALKIVLSFLWKERKVSHFCLLFRSLPGLCSNGSLACMTCLYSLACTLAIPDLLTFYASLFRLHCTKLRFWHATLALLTLFSGLVFKCSHRCRQRLAGDGDTADFWLHCYAQRICL